MEVDRITEEYGTVPNRVEFNPLRGMNPICGLSCNGVNVWGDQKSIDAVQKAFHLSSQIAELRTAFDLYMNHSKSTIKSLEDERDAALKGRSYWIKKAFEFDTQIKKLTVKLNSIYKNDPDVVEE